MALGLAAFLPSIIGWFANKGIGKITDQLDAARAARAEAERLENHLEVKRLDAKIIQLELRAAGFKGDRRVLWIQLAVSLPAFVVLWKLGVDITMSNWPEYGLRTDPPSVWFQGYMGIVLSFWLLKITK